MTNSDETKKYIENLMEKLPEELRKGINESHFLVKYQPIYDIVSMEVVGCEALTRWVHPAIERISLQNFILIVEDSGLSHQAFNWKITTIQKDLKQRGDALSKVAPVYFKLTKQQFYHESLSSMVFDLMQQLSLPQRNLIMQVEETDLLDQSGCPESVLQQLKSDGILTAIAGVTGHPLIEMLVEEKMFHCVKLDRRLTKSIIEDKIMRQQFNKLNELCQKNQTLLVVTGIEGNKDLNAIRGCKYQYGQGFILGAPMLNYQFTEMLRKKAKFSSNRYN